MKHVVISPLSTYERHGWWSFELGIFLLCAIGSRKYRVSIHPAHKVDPVMAARNLICKKFLKETTADWLLMIDNDMRPPTNLLDMLDDIPPEADIAVPIMHLWNEVNKFPAICWRPKDIAINQVKMSEEETRKLLGEKWIELEACGSGAMFVRRKVLETLPYPWFARRFDEDGKCTHSEDTLFTEAASKAGFRIFGATQFVVGHWRTVDLADVPVPEKAITPESFV